MAVSGVRLAESARGEWFDELMFWGVMYRRVSLVLLVRGSWAFALGASALIVLLLPLVASLRSGGGLYALLGVLVLVHVIARGWVERRLPNPSFAEDVRTGNFEQLRLTPHSAHTLLLQRGLPDLLFRGLTMSLWLPLYALVARALGMTLVDALALWLLFGFANYFVLGMTSLALLLSGWERWLWVFVPVLAGYAAVVDNGRTRTAVASSGLLGAMLALPVLGRVLLPMDWLVVLPDLRPIVALWLLAELLRFERTARWIGAPSGIWRGYYLLPSALAVALIGALVGQQGEVFYGYTGAAQTQLAVVGAFAATGYLSLYLLTLRRHAESVVQPLRVHLRETGLLRLLSALLVGAGVLVSGLPAGGGVFWGVFLWLSVVEWLGGALARYGLQRVHSRAPMRAYLLIALGAVPAIAFWSYLPLPVIGALSPTYALLMASEARPLAHLTGMPVPLLLCLALPLVRYAVLLTAVWLSIAVGVKQRLGARAQAALRWLALPLLYPLLDWLVRHRATNPISRLLINERHLPFAPLLGMVTFAVVFYTASTGRGTEWVWIFVPYGIFLWLWGYYTAARCVRRWVESGELTSAFLAGLTPPQVYWGWVYGTWYHQLRIFLAIVGGIVWGEVLGAVPSLARSTGPLLAQILIGAGLSFAVVYIALWATAWLIAAPAAVRDRLLLAKGDAPLVPARATVMGVFAGLIGCCAPLAPFMLVALPMYASQSTVALQKLARAPAELTR
ncbi:MAG: hypothetical protein RMK45_08620 [Armatimonadota bacterium]|nr:hypothetical protein [Armatimonadota bacterium]